MKKLSLKNLKLNSRNVLQREKLKTIFGGCGHDVDCHGDDETGGGGGGCITFQHTCAVDGQVPCCAGMTCYSDFPNSIIGSCWFG